MKLQKRTKILSCMLAFVLVFSLGAGVAHAAPLQATGCKEFYNGTKLHRERAGIDVYKSLNGVGAIVWGKTVNAPTPKGYLVIRPNLFKSNGDMVHWGKAHPNPALKIDQAYEVGAMVRNKSGTYYAGGWIRDWITSWSDWYTPGELPKTPSVKWP